MPGTGPAHRGLQRFTVEQIGCRAGTDLGLLPQRGSGPLDPGLCPQALEQDFTKGACLPCSPPWDIWQGLGTFQHHGMGEGGGEQVLLASRG